MLSKPATQQNSSSAAGGDGSWCSRLDGGFCRDPVEVFASRPDGCSIVGGSALLSSANLGVQCEKGRDPFFNTTTPIIAKFITFSYCSLVFSNGFQKWTLTVSQDCRTGMFIGLYVKRFLKDWKKLLSKAPLTDFQNAWIHDAI